jgi:hypothetical protein
VTLFHRLFDDAAIFPPGTAAMPDAVPSHIGWRSSPASQFVGAFVCSSPRWAEFAESLAAAGACGVGVSVTVPVVAAVQDALAAGSAEPRATVVSVEVPVADQAGLDDALKLLDTVVLDGVTAFVELPWSAIDHDACNRLAAGPHHLKIRTGGPSADSFPSEELLARMIGRAVEHHVPFKLTAGLHDAVRHHDPVTAFEHHGFLNVIVATAAALTGNNIHHVQSLLAAQDAEHVAELVRRLPPEAVREIRRQFVSFGTCSIDEPLQDLMKLRLIA